ncbi:hypothetical protein BCR32DRAFT_275875 [Anaeromyces robustus]|uniref:Uncharacterized protein n=1 Tax=Anaeromyces robustus TaxID=1754192 RepID=A0A1Y1XKD5_9FUNG|nr:hypothetical protein BCR32DRAFT_275875 [Anaeromyces robustus]|eukprot:ORX85916.1 hypothetical protein BCR32DRAFT_275875 [Anaeromyces robustus]
MFFLLVLCILLTLNNFALSSTVEEINDRPVVEYSVMSIVKLLNKLDIEGLPCYDSVCLGNNFDEILNSLDDYKLSYNNTIVDNKLKFDIPLYDSFAYWDKLESTMKFSDDDKINKLILFSTLSSTNLFDPKMIKMIVAMNYLNDEELSYTINYFLKFTNFNVNNFFNLYGNYDKGNYGDLLINNYTYKRVMIVQNFILCNVIPQFCNDRTINFNINSSKFSVTNN